MSDTTELWEEAMLDPVAGLRRGFSYPGVSSQCLIWRGLGADVVRDNCVGQLRLARVRIMPSCPSQSGSIGVVRAPCGSALARVARFISVSA